MIWVPKHNTPLFIIAAGLGVIARLGSGWMINLRLRPDDGRVRGLCVVCKYAYVYVCVHVCVYACVHVCVCACVCVCTDTPIHMCTLIC